MSRYSEATPEYRSDVKRRSTERRRRNPQAYLWEKAKRRAFKQGVEFNIEPQDLVIPERCPILGIPIKILSKSRNSSATVDRVNPALGYTKGNVPVISFRANMLKNDATIEELQAIIDWMKSFEPSEIDAIKKLIGIR